jgi:hypothetical protein
VSRSQFVVALVISAVAAVLPLSLLAWITSGSWSPSRVRGFDLALVLPMLVAVQLGLGRAAALAVSFFAYWVLAFAVLGCYIRNASLEVRPKVQSGGEV